MGKKYPVERQGDNGWSRWIAPIHKSYKMACCDCGLVHELQFRVVKEGSSDGKGGWRILPARVRKLRVLFRARRNNRATGQIRRWSNISVRKE